MSLQWESINFSKTEDISEDLMKFVINYTLEKCPDQFEYLDKFIENSLIFKLNKVVNSKLIRATYKECIEILKKTKLIFNLNLNMELRLIQVLV